MGINVNEKERYFSITTQNTEYQLKADRFGVLKHLWYGGKTGCDMEYLLEYPDVGFSGAIDEADNDRTYSLDTMPLEYPCGGVGDFRVPAIEVTHADGSTALDLRYKGYCVKDGKYDIPGLPAVHAEKTKAQTLEITLCDTATDTEVILRYGVLEELDIITRSAEIRNNGDSPIFLKKAASFSLDVPYGNWEWIHFQGRHTLERLPERAPLIHGIQESSNIRGASSHQQNPSFIICSPDCGERYGKCYGAFLVYSGSFQTQIELDQLNQTRAVMGINPRLFGWKLNVGESFHTPEAVMTYSGSGFSKLSHNFHKVIRENICRGKYKLAERPVLINNWEATYFDFDANKIQTIAENAAALGADMLVLDDGWFGKRDSDCSGLGDWFVNEKKLPGGLGTLVEKVKALGMKFGLWFEPEMVSEDSELYRVHPDWAIKIPDRKPTRGRYQLVLDMSRKDIRDYLYDSIAAILKSAEISYIKWDANRSICDWYSGELSAERQDELPHRYILGLYELFERLNTDFPNVLFEGCSGGGGRFDAGMLYYCPQIWCSDDTDAFERAKIQYGTSFIYPISTIGSHVSVVPNHQTGRITPIETRAVTAMAGSFGYELDLGTLSDEEKKAVSEQIKRFKKYAPLIHGGRYYRLSNPTTENIALWEYASEDMSEVLIHGMVFRTEPNMKCIAIKAVLDPECKYKISGSTEVYTGAALMNGGILLPKTWGDYCPIEIHLIKQNIE